MEKKVANRKAPNFAVLLEIWVRYISSKISHLLFYVAEDIY